MDSVTPPSSSPAPAASSEVTPAAATSGAPAAEAPKSPKTPGSLQAAADAVDKVVPPEGQGAPKETAAEKKARLLKLKVYGEESEYDIDNTPDEVLAKDLQLSKAARKVMSEAAAERKRIQEAIEYGRNDPEAALKDLFGIEDPVAWMEKRLTEKYGAEAKKAQMTPEQIEAEALKAKIAEYEKREAQAKEAQKAQAREAMNKKILEDTKATFAEALEQSGLPKTQRVMAEMARLMKTSLQHGIKLTPAQLAMELKAEFSGGLKQIATSLDGEKLLAELGDDVVKKVIRAQLAKVGKTPVPTTPVVQPTVTKEDDEVPPGTPIWLRSAFRSK